MMPPRDAWAARYRADSSLVSLAPEAAAEAEVEAFTLGMMATEAPFAEGEAEADRVEKVESWEVKCRFQRTFSAKTQRKDPRSEKLVESGKSN